MTKVPVLVTGGAGYIGSHAMLALKDAGWSVAVVDDLSNGVRRAVPDDVPFVEGDIADLDLAERTLAEHEIDVVVNFAAESHNSLAVIDFFCWPEQQYSLHRSSLHQSGSGQPR